MRPSTLYALFCLSCLLIGVSLTLHGQASATAGEGSRAARAALVRDYQLTDLCLFTEARYTRHPAMADRHAPFQDHPVALEHFPSGALIGPRR